MQTIKYRRDLYKLLPDIKNAVCAEIGVAEGYFSADMLGWKIAKLYMVDRWECMPSMRGDSAQSQEWHTNNYNAAIKRVEKYGNKAVILRGTSSLMSQHVPDKSLDLIHLDGDHSYAGVMADLESWFPKMKKGGIISGHDYLAPMYGVKEAVTLFASRHGVTVHLLTEDKPEDAGFYFIV